MPTLLIVEDEAILARNLAKAFATRGWTVTQAATAADSRRVAGETPPHVVLLDLRLPDGSGLDVLTDLLAATPDLPVIMMTGHGSVADAVEAMQRGARDFVQKPLELEEIRLKVERALGATREHREVAYHRERQRLASEILGESDPLQRLRTMVERLAKATRGPGAPAPTVLLLGETGAGKGHVARALHAAGGRSDGPFIEVNCTALPDGLVEAELFGHEKGAFTDARTARPGLFETADGGTVFLDEIGHISAPLQSKFLNVIEEKTVRRIGATAARAVDVQVIAATSRDLDAAVKLGEFRADLQQRLTVAVIRIPPLRERGRDAVAAGTPLSRRGGAPLCRGRRARSRPRPRPPSLRTAGRATCASSPIRWSAPCSSPTPSPSAPTTWVSAPPRPAAPGASAPARRARSWWTCPEGGLALEAVERALLLKALERAGGNQSAAARLLGLSRDTLRYRMDKFGLES